MAEPAYGKPTHSKPAHPAAPEHSSWHWLTEVASSVECV